MIAWADVKKGALGVKAKITFMALFIGFLIFGITVYFSNRFKTLELESDLEEKALLILEHVLHDLEEDIPLTPHKRIPETLNVYRGRKEIQAIRLFNNQGREVFANEEGPGEPNLAQVLHTGNLFHYHQQGAGMEVANYLIPLKNKPQCFACHSHEENMRGILALSISLERMKTRLAEENRKYFFLFAVLAVVVGTITFLAANRFLLQPLKRLQQGAETIEKGKFAYQIPATSSDEIGILARAFNRMARNLRIYFEEINNKNQELAEQNRLLHQTQKDWQETFDTIVDQVAIIEDNFQIVQANRSFRAFHSLAPQGPIPKRCYELIECCPGLDLPEGSHCPHCDMVQNRKPLSQERFDEENGKAMEVSFFPYDSIEGSCGRVIYIAKDISARKENELRRIMAERLAALGQMASGIAHEIRNPLATIGACAEGLLLRSKKGQVNLGVLTNYLTIIGEEIRRCESITDSMLSFVRQKGNGKREVDFISVLEYVLEMISFQGRMKDVVVSRNYEDGIPKFSGDENDFRQAFLAIVVNALDAMEDKGTLTVEAGSKEKAIHIRITDTGPGIPSALKHLVFDPFFTTKSKTGGTGLGLAIARHIIGEYGGKIETDSEEGKGATFKVTLQV
jgi:nitrogen fixation/metabolism regulation signal transduction histidine kinase